MSRPAHALWAKLRSFLESNASDRAVATVMGLATVRRTRALLRVALISLTTALQKRHEAVEAVAAGKVQTELANTNVSLRVQGDLDHYTMVRVPTVRVCNFCPLSALIHRAFVVFLLPPGGTARTLQDFKASTRYQAHPTGVLPHALPRNYAPTGSMTLCACGLPLALQHWIMLTHPYTKQIRELSLDDYIAYFTACSKALMPTERVSKRELEVMSSKPFASHVMSVRLPVSASSWMCSWSG